MSKELERQSKFLSLVLRHKPEEIGLSLDDAGWADVEALILKAGAKGVGLTRERIRELVVTSNKQRFTLSEDGQRIRANQGHSVAVNLSLPECTPPARLFHGTATRFLDSIRAQGLLPGSRQQVHLSPDLATAAVVGQRHGKPVVLVVRAEAMHRDGHKFFVSENGVWLTAEVPVAYLDFEGG